MFVPDAVYCHKDGRKTPVAYLAQEFVDGFELFDWVCNTGAFPPAICRYYMKQMLQGLHYLHSKGLAHRDLKLENILLDDQFRIKFIDFGVTTLLKGKSNDGLARTVVGTLGYMAPEIIQERPYRADVVDLFAMGVALFTMYAREVPFAIAQPNDPKYKLISTNRADLFWKAHSDRHPPGFFSEEFKSLIGSMLAMHPENRLSIADIASHPWMNGEHATYAEVYAEFTARQQLNLEKKRQEAL